MNNQEYDDGVIANIHAERSVLGSMLRDNGVIGEVLQNLRDEEFFYKDAHRKIFSAIVSMYDQGVPADLTTLANELLLRGQIEDVGGYPYFAELWEAAPTSANVAYYAKIVRDQALGRQLWLAAKDIARNAAEGRAPIGELMEAAANAIEGIAQRGLLSTTVRLSESINSVYDRYEARANRGGMSGLSTGFLELDEKIAGLHEGELIVIAARPSVGKTQFALSVAIHVAHRQGIPVFFATLEQTHLELTERLLVREANVDGHRFRRGVMNEEEIKGLLAAGARLSKAPLIYDDSPGQTMLRVAANARRLKLKEGIGLVLVDYLQLVESEKPKPTRQEEVSSISRRLKHLARELAVPVVALSQLNRAVEIRADPTPRLSDLRDSGAVEQDADVVLLLHRPNDNENIVKLNVAKQRNGPIGEMELTFDRRRGCFADCFPDILAE
jgi:replicative DNA helicase